MLRKSKISFKEHKFISLNIDKTIGKKHATNLHRRKEKGGFC
tara:strand:+ start:1008 stop:1133 length:126 start_codon:yes stop_codon:yes gene_type:complete